MNYNRCLNTLLSAVFFTSALFLPAGAHAEQINRKKIAILNFKAYNTAQRYADGVRDILEVNLYKTGVFHILEREQIDIILREHEIRDRWCEDQGCAVEMGKLLSTDKVVVGSVSGMGDFSIAIKLVDIKNGDVEYADSETARGEKKIPAATQALAERFARRIKSTYMPAQVSWEEKEPEGPGWISGIWNSPYRPYYIRGFVPGWGQLYAGRFYKGVAFATIFALTAAYTGYSVYDWRKKREEYEDLDSGINREFDDKHDAAGRALKKADAMLWITAGLYVLNYIDILFFSKPDTVIKPQTRIIYYNKTPFFFVYHNADGRPEGARFDAGFNLRF